MEDNKELFTMEGFKKTDLEHHGVKGQKWGERRYQNSDGSLTPEGRKRYRQSKEQLRNRYQSLKQDAEALRIANKQVKKLENRDEPIFIPERHLVTTTRNQMKMDFTANTEQFKKDVDDFKKEYGKNKLKNLDVDKPYKIANNYISHLSETLVSALTSSPLDNALKGMDARDRYDSVYERTKAKLQDKGEYPDDRGIEEVPVLKALREEKKERKKEKKAGKHRVRIGYDGEPEVLY